MKVVILAGGLGTRLSEETGIRPKPMVEIGGRPILWHIMKLYSHYGFNDFIICLGYKGYMVKEYFHHYFMYNSNMTVDLGSNELHYHDSQAEPWKITLVDTGMNTMTGGRIKKIKKFVNDETFMLTYGDAVSDIDIKALVAFHKKQGRLATVTSVQHAGKFGSVQITKKGAVASFQEKPQHDGSWISGGFFVLEPGVFDYIKDGDDTIWERAPMELLVKKKQFSAYQHKGFWKCMDTLRDKNDLETIWHAKRTAPWKVWKD